MIIAVLLYFVTGIIAVIASIFNSVSFFTPTWMLQGEADILQGPAHLQGFLPIYAHPAMSGIASQTGIMPMFGFLVLVFSTIVLVGVIWGGINVSFRILGRGRSSSLSSTSDAEG